MNKFIATKNDENRTIYKYLIKMMPNVPLSRIHKLFRNSDIKINNQRKIKSNYILKNGDEIIVYGLKEINLNAKLPKVLINFKVLYEDENILVVSKKPNVAIHGEENSLDRQVLTYLSFEPKDSFTPSHVGRIDKASSGIVVYGKNYFTVRELNKKIHHFTKIYQFKSDLNKNMTAKVKLIHSEKLNLEIESPNGKEAITKFFKNNKNNYAQLLTGRKHQIRATLKILGFPILGDKKYGGKSDYRLFLHHTRLIFHNLEGKLTYLNEQIFDDKPDW